MYFGNDVSIVYLQCKQIILMLIIFNIIGYVGPDDLESFINVHKITYLLNKTHVLPYKIDLKEKPANVFFIGTDQTGIRAKVMKMS